MLVLVGLKIHFIRPLISILCLLSWPYGQESLIWHVRIRFHFVGNFVYIGAHSFLKWIRRNLSKLICYNFHVATIILNHFCSFPKRTFKIQCIHINYDASKLHILLSMHLLRLTAPFYEMLVNATLGRQHTFWQLSCYWVVCFNFGSTFTTLCA